MTAQIPSVIWQHKCTGSGNTVETSLHLALELCSYLLSTSVCMWKTADNNILGRGRCTKPGRGYSLLSLPPLHPSFHCCWHKKGYWEQPIPSPPSQAAIWSQLSDAAFARLVAQISKCLWAGRTAVQRYLELGGGNCLMAQISTSRRAGSGAASARCISMTGIPPKVRVPELGNHCYMYINSCYHLISNETQPTAQTCPKSTLCNFMTSFLVHLNMKPLWNIFCIQS